MTSGPSPLSRIRGIAERMAARIPHPRRKPPKPQKSFGGLAEGQKLRLLDGQSIYTSETGKVKRGALLQVTSCTNQSMVLTILEDLSGSARPGSTFEWKNREWKGMFEKAGRT